MVRKRSSRETSPPLEDSAPDRQVKPQTSAPTSPAAELRNGDVLKHYVEADCYTVCKIDGPKIWLFESKGPGPAMSMTRRDAVKKAQQYLLDEVAAKLECGKWVYLRRITWSNY